MLSTPRYRPQIARSSRVVFKRYPLRGRLYPSGATRSLLFPIRKETRPCACLI